MSLETTRNWWTRVRQLQSDLNERHPGGALYIQPTNDPQRNSCGGLAVEVSAENAAKAIANGTHVEATEGDIAKATRQGRDNLLISQAQELRAHGAVKVTLSKGRE
jgi:hypothetical protein